MERQAGHHALPRSLLTQGVPGSRPSPRPPIYASRDDVSYEGVRPLQVAPWCINSTVFGIMRYCLLPVVSPPPFAGGWAEGLLPPSFDDPVKSVRLGSDDRLRLLITHRPPSATQPAIKMAG